MKPMHLKDLNVAVTINADAARWVDQTRVNIRDYAHDQAVRRLNGLPLDRGVTVTLDCEDDRQTEGEPEARKIRRANEGGGESTADAGKNPAAVPTAKPAPVCAPASAEAASKGWFKNSTDGGNDVSELVFIADDHEHWYGKNGTGDDCYGNYTAPAWYLYPITPTEAAKWLKCNGHQAEAAKLLGQGEEYEPVEVQPRKGDRMRCVENGREVVAGANGVQSGHYGLRDTDLWFTRTAGVGGVYTLKNGGGYRILRRRAPDAGKVVGRG